MGKTKKAKDFEELEKCSVEYDLSISPRKRIEMVQYLREQYYKSKGIKPAYFIGMNELIKCKSASPIAKDKIDVENLLKVKQNFQ